MSFPDSFSGEFSQGYEKNCQIFRKAVTCLSPQQHTIYNDSVFDQLFTPRDQTDKCRLSGRGCQIILFVWDGRCIHGGSSQGVLFTRESSSEHSKVRYEPVHSELEDCSLLPGRYWVWSTRCHLMQCDQLMCHAIQRKCGIIPLCCVMWIQFTCMTNDWE